jgi:NAD(P)-dependent dehydrogenase (short-subunit alcohol dehydrogenase family)
LSYIAVIALALVALLAVRIIVLSILRSRSARKELVTRQDTGLIPSPALVPGNKDFAGKVAIVTGGGTGLGRAIALNLASRGARLVIASRNPDHLNAVAAEISALGADVLAVPVDVREHARVEDMVRQAVERFGRIDILVNNAAGNFAIPAEKLRPNGWNAVAGIVLNGTWYVSSAVGRQMIKQGGGCILNIVANYASSGAPGVVHSGAAKAGVLNMTRTLAVEWGRYGIRVNALAPGAMVTSGASKNLGYDSPEAQEKIRTRVPLGRLTSAGEMAGLAVFLCSDQAAYLTGDLMTADGGLGLPRGLLDLQEAG